MNTKKIIVWTLAFVIVIVSGVLLVFGNEIKDFFTVEKEKIVKVEVEKEVVKMVEKDKIPTYDLIMYLNSRVDPAVAEIIGEAVDRYSKQYQLPKKLILGIIHHESNFDYMAKSSVGALGLMQVYPKFHEDKLKERNLSMSNSDLKKLYHVNVNIDIGCEIFKKYFDASDGDLDETFHKYLSKNATEEQKNKYMNDILETYARLEFLEYKEGMKTDIASK